MPCCRASRLRAIDSTSLLGLFAEGLFVPPAERRRILSRRMSSVTPLLATSFLLCPWAALMLPLIFSFLANHQKFSFIRSSLKSVRVLLSFQMDPFSPPLNFSLFPAVSIRKGHLGFLLYRGIPVQVHANSVEILRDAPPFLCAGNRLGTYGLFVFLP